MYDPNWKLEACYRSVGLELGNGGDDPGTACDSQPQPTPVPNPPVVVGTSHEIHESLETSLELTPNSQCLMFTNW